jgi:hypothetical protein
LNNTIEATKTGSSKRVSRTLDGLKCFSISLSRQSYVKYYRIAKFRVSLIR